MNGKQHHQVLSGAHSRDHLMEHAKNSGVNWEEHSHEGVNWMRASKGMVNHVNNGKKIDTDQMDDKSVQSMLDHYTVIRDHHKKSMVPHLRSAMAKLHAEKGDPSLNPMDLLDDAHEHLKANGGEVWAEKLHTLNHINGQIKKLSTRIQSKQQST